MKYWDIYTPIPILLNGYGNVLSTHRTVYGINFLYSTVRYSGHAFVELYAGLSLRIATDKNLIYTNYDYFDTVTEYSPPKETTKTLFLPAIQGGINIGLGFGRLNKRTN